MFSFIAYLLVLLPWTVVGLLGMFIVWLFTAPFDPKRTAVHVYSRSWGWFLLHPTWRWKVEVEGFENIPKGVPMVIASNHQHMLDTPLLLHLPLKFRFVGKKELFSQPVVGQLLKMRGDVALDRSGLASAKAMVSDCTKFLKLGVSIAIFPEGTRTKTGEIGEFHSGAFLLVKRNRVPILPVVITGSYEAMDGMRGWGPRHKIRMKVLPPITAQMVQEMSLGDLTKHTRDVISTAFDEQRAQQN